MVVLDKLLVANRFEIAGFTGGMSFLFFDCLSIISSSILILSSNERRSEMADTAGEAALLDGSVFSASEVGLDSFSSLMFSSLMKDMLRRDAAGTFREARRAKLLVLELSESSSKGFSSSSLLIVFCCVLFFCSFSRFDVLDDEEEGLDEGNAGLPLSLIESILWGLMVSAENRIDCLT